MEDNIETVIKEKINEHFINKEVDEYLIDNWEDVNNYATFLCNTFHDTFQNIATIDDNNRYRAINEIRLPFRENNIEFTIEIINWECHGRYTVYCPELIGCITEGNSKMEALTNLCFAISETLVLNFDCQKLNPITPNCKGPSITKEYFVSNIDAYSYNASKRLSVEGKFKNFYLGKKHLLLKNDLYPKITLTLPHSGLKELTRHLIQRVANIE